MTLQQVAHEEVSDPGVAFTIVHLLQALSNAVFVYSCEVVDKVSADTAVARCKVSLLGFLLYFLRILLCCFCSWRSIFEF